MTYHGQVENGQIVLDPSVVLPDGAKVTVSLSNEPRSEQKQVSATTDARDALMQFAGIAKNLPSDAARNLDHYLYGHPKQ